MTNENNHWHLDKRFSWGHIITTVGLVIAGVFYFTDLAERVGLVEKDIVHIRTEDAKHEQFAVAQMNRLELKIESQTKRLEGRMEAQYNEIIRRLEILDQRMIENAKEDGRNHTQ